MTQPTTTVRGVPRASTSPIFPGLLLFVLAIGGFGAPAGGEIEAEPQFQVSDATTGYVSESQASVASDADGNFVVVWRGDYEYYGPPYGRLIQGRRFGADGTPRGYQFQVSNTATGYAYESRPSVAADEDGNFVVVWRDYQYYYGRLIRGRRFAADGTPRDDQFQVNSTAIGYAYYLQPSVAADADGDFVVVWHSYQYPGPPAGYVIQGRRFAADGTPGGPQFQVGSITTGYAYEREPSVAADADGDFVVVWRGYYQWPGPPYGYLVQGRRFAADGTPGGPQFQVSSNTTGSGYERQPSVAADADGDFVVVWRDYQDPDGQVIQGRLFASNGTPGGPQFQIGSASYYSEPSVASDADGDFVVVWSDYQDPDGQVIQGRLFASDGTPDGPQFQVGSASYYSGESVASDANGDFVVVWRDYQEQPDQPYGYLIQGRQFSVGIGVDIDIMPSDPGNNLNLRAGKGATISVALLSVDGFETPNLIDPSTLEFGPGQASISGSPRVRDADGDGDEDLLVKFPTDDAGIACGDTRASLSGYTFDSQSIIGSDAINTFNCPRVRKRW
jgi:hypothetical protein